MTTSGDGLWKRVIHVPMCLLGGANARIRNILRRLRTKKSETKRTVNELDEPITRLHSRHKSEIEELREEKDELLNKPTIDDVTIGGLIDDQKYMAEQIQYLKEDNEITQNELKMATDTIIELRESNEKLMNDLYQLERKCLDQEVQLNDLRAASAAAFARNAATAKGIKPTVATAAARPATVSVVVSDVDQMQPLRSILKNRAIDRSQTNPECVSNLRLQVNNNHVWISIFLCVRYTLLSIFFSVQLILKNCVFLTFKYFF